jgi:hypothetical protein
MDRFCCSRLSCWARSTFEMPCGGKRGLVSMRFCRRALSSQRLSSKFYTVQSGNRIRRKSLKTKNRPPFYPVQIRAIFVCLFFVQDERKSLGSRFANPLLIATPPIRNCHNSCGNSHVHPSNRNWARGIFSRAGRTAKTGDGSPLAPFLIDSRTRLYT